MYMNKMKGVTKREKFEAKNVKTEFKVRNDDEVKEKLRKSKYSIYEIKNSLDNMI